MRRSQRHGEIEEHHVVLNRVFHVVPGKGIRVLTHQLQRVGTRLLWGNLTRNTLLGNVFGTHAHGQALAKRAGFEQVGHTNLVAAGRTFEHALGGLALKGRAAEGAGNAHVCGLLELLRRPAIFPQQMLQNRLIAPVRIEEIPFRVLRTLELRDMRELEQPVNHRQRCMANAQSALRLPSVRLPRDDRSAIGALKAAFCLVRIHGAAAVLAFNGKHLVHGNFLLCTGAVDIKYVEQTGACPYPCGPKWSTRTDEKAQRAQSHAGNRPPPPRAR